MRRILVIPHDLNHLGGGSCVAAWALQALVARYELSILTWERADLRITNRVFGTSLDPRDFHWYQVARPLVHALALAPIPLAHLRNQILYAKAKRLVRAKRFDAVLGLMNEIDIGGRAIQYIHYPWAYWPRPDYDLRWYHYLPLVRAYRKAAAALSGYDQRRVGANLTVTNSDWTGALYRACYGAPARTLYPPVPGGFPEVPFSERAPTFVCIGRIAPEKRVEDVIRILEAVRARGHDIGLRIIGHEDSESYTKRILAMATDNAAWISVHRDVPRSELVRLVARNRYGIHAMEGEHFGIAPAELQRAGCITFVRAGGGASEIVGNDERVIFDSVEDAIEKIDRVLSDAALESELRRDVEARKALFTEERFMREIVELVESFLASEGRR